MQWFANLKTSYKLALSFGTCLVLTAIIGTTALYRMAQLNSATALLVSDSVDGLKYAGNVTENMMTFRRLELQYLLLSDKASKSSSIKQMNDELAELDMHMAEYEQSADHAQDRRNLAELKRLWATYLQGHPKFMELCRRNDLKRAKAYVANESSGSFASVDRQLDVIRTWNEAQAAVQTKSAAAVYSTGRSVILGLLVAAVALGLFSAFVVTRRITTAMSQIDSRISSIHNVCIANLSVAIEAMARGDLTSRIDTGTELLTIQSRDEFGNMAHTVNRVIQKLHAMVASFLNAQDALSKTLGQVQTSADSIAAATAEVAAGNEDLSQRTEEQASSLEETASSMEQMTATVKQSAENARHANQLAMQARTVAEKGGDVVGSAIASMDEINHVSKQIADIVSVIDEIAFQTNLLALNAAVEAARVGEQGRGFAVVAAEVRTLAGRSATASKEIKALVHESVTRVQQGTVLVNQSGAQLNEIVTAVKKVADMIAEISAAGQEQSAGIEQVNKAVMQMDQITQQNAALAEQATAASQSMNVQAGSLLEAVSQFTIDSQYLSAPSAPELREVEVVAATGTYGGGRRRFRSAGAPTLKLSRVSGHGDPVVKDDDFGEF